MADTLVNIILRAKDEASKAVKGLKGNLEKLNKSGLGQAITGLTGFNLSSVGAATAVIAVGNAVKQAVTNWSDYAEQMDKSAKLAGVSSEEMSRLTQAADDFRVSQEALKTAMGMALKNGFTPTIENLANLSDEFIALKDPADRAALAAKIFGRGWQEIAPLLLKGGDAIRAGTASIADNLIVTDEAVKANQEYIKAMDDLQDSWMGVKNSAAQWLIPALTNVMDALNGEEVNRAVNGYERMFKSAKDNLAGFEDVGKDVNEMLKEQAAAGGDAAGGIQGVADATNSADAAMRKYSESLLFSIASQGLDADEALALAQRMGLVDQNTVLATEKTNEYKAMLDSGAITMQEYIRMVDDLSTAINNIPDNKTITVTYNQITTGTAPNGYWQGSGEGGNQQMEAYGDPVYAGQQYWVGERGPEPFIPAVDGRILSHEDAMAALSGRAGNKGGGNTYNIFSSANPGQIQNALRISELLGGAG